MNQHKKGKIQLGGGMCGIFKYLLIPYYQKSFFSLIYQIQYILIHNLMSQAVNKQPKKKPIAKSKNQKALRLWVKAKFIGFRRSKVQQNTNQSILRLDGVNDRNSSQYYFGKRVVFVYKAKSGQKDKRFRTIWGRIGRGHGNNGAVLARFKSNLPPRAMGSTLRVMLFPQRG